MVIYFNGLSWLYSHLWAIDNVGEEPYLMFDIVSNTINILFQITQTKWSGSTIQRQIDYRF